MYVSRPKPATFFRNPTAGDRGARLAPASPSLAGLSPGGRFRYALEERGGLYTAFGQFLSWRVDLVGGELATLLARVRVRPGIIPRAEVARGLVTTFGSRGAALAQGLDADPCWNTGSRCAYRASLDGRRIVVQFARDPVPDSEFAEFERGLPLLDEKIAPLAFTPEVLTQFRQWYRLAETPGRERSYLEALSGARGDIFVEYPAVLPEFSGERLLSWDWVEGEPISGLLSRGAGEITEKLAECVLEQLSILSVVDGDLDPDALVLTPGGRLAVRRACRLIAIPPALVRTTLKYISAALAGDSTLTAHLLVRLATGSGSRTLESRLLSALSSLVPELKVGLQFPPSAAVFESNWRALSQAGISRPLFVDCLHRSLVAVGYWEAEAAARGVPSRDAIGQAQWSVLGRLLRTRIRDLASRDAVSEWFVGSTLLFFDGMRQMGRLAEEFRDNDISLGIEADQETRQGAVGNRTVRAGIIGGLLVIVFLTCLRWGVSASAPLSTGLAVLAVLAAAGLFWTISRMG